MGRLSYYFAASMDGYIARKDGTVDFLDMYQTPIRTPYGYTEFYDSVSTVVMGRKTYEVIEGFGGNPYDGKPIFVYSSDSSLWTEWKNTEFIQQSPDLHIEQIKEETEGRIWLAGGGQLARSLMKKNLIDEIVLTLIPVTLTEGIPWLAPGTEDHYWSLKEHFVTELGLVQLIYHPNIN